MSRFVDFAVPFAGFLASSSTPSISATLPAGPPSPPASCLSPVTAELLRKAALCSQPPLQFSQLAPGLRAAAPSRIACPSAWKREVPSGTGAEAAGRVEAQRGRGKESQGMRLGTQSQKLWLAAEMKPRLQAWKLVPVRSAQSHQKLGVPEG